MRFANLIVVNRQCNVDEVLEIREKGDKSTVLFYKVTAAVITTSTLQGMDAFLG